MGWISLQCTGDSEAEVVPGKQRERKEGEWLILDFLDIDQI